ncbi:MAG TPA: Holliday junction branch migration protein RuvA, partial [Kofleriaceae bacterium]|nr:Holliday junction branch migration protein RuvA [Kofleriaceae bacterium]
MIARLDGTLIERDPPRIIVDCHGVGYDVIVSAYTLAGLPADGERVALRIFTHATETKLSLFGFLEAPERALFELLITVKNVGPSTAIAILSGSSPHDMAAL